MTHQSSLTPWIHLLLVLSLQLQAGCASFGAIDNQPLPEIGPTQRYSVAQALHATRSNEVTLVLAFSGGGTRAAALAYGVLAALRDTRVVLDGQSRRLLDEVDAISAVSGGSFTAAYYGVYGDGIFTDFEDRFLRYDVSSELVHGLLHPALWFSSSGRTDMAIDYYDRKVFRGATFADLQRRDGPLIAINATDLGRGVRFSFLQDYFDLLCSDLSTFRVARAVAASSAVPVLFHPVVLRNYPGCSLPDYAYLNPAHPALAASPQLAQVVTGLGSYAQKDRRRFIHLVDGGITDNLGLLAIYEMIEVAGGAKRFLQSIGGVPTPRFIIISVNASTTPQYDMELSNAVPSMESIINAVTDAQIHRTNAATIELLRNSIRRWSAELNRPGFTVEPYFVELDFEAIAQPERRHYFNQIPTSFSLTQPQADDLIAAGRELLLGNPEFRRFLGDVGAGP
ncbi:MAG: patatin-like phospholipase family protein [Pseudomonadota bacterium]